MTESAYRESAAPRKPSGQFSPGASIWFFWESVESLRVVWVGSTDSRLVIITKSGDKTEFRYPSSDEATGKLGELLVHRQEWYEHLARLSAGSRFPE